MSYFTFILLLLFRTGLTQVTPEGGDNNTNQHLLPFLTTTRFFPQLSHFLQLKSNEFICPSSISSFS